MIIASPDGELAVRERLFCALCRKEMNEDVWCRSSHPPICLTCHADRGYSLRYNLSGQTPRPCAGGCKRTVHGSYTSRVCGTEECKRRYALQLRRERYTRQHEVADDHQHRCEVCDGEFKAKRSDARFCSATCRQKAHRSQVKSMSTRRGYRPKVAVTVTDVSDVGRPPADIEITCDEAAA